MKAKTLLPVVGCKDGNGCARKPTNGVRSLSPGIITPGEARVSSSCRDRDTAEARGVVDPDPTT